MPSSAISDRRASARRSRAARSEACRGSPCAVVDQVEPLIGVPLEVVQLVFGRRAPLGVDVDRVLHRASRMHEPGWADLGASRGCRRLMVVVGEVDRVLDRWRPPGCSAPARDRLERASASRSGGRAASSGLRSCPRAPRGPRRRRARAASAAGRRARRERRSRPAGEQSGVRDDERDPDRLLVGVERLLAQAAVREAHLAMIGERTSTVRERSEPGSPGSPSAASMRPTFSSTSRCRWA